MRYILVVGFLLLGCADNSKIEIHKKKTTYEREVLVKSEENSADAEALEQEGDILELYREGTFAIVRQQCRGCHDSQVAPYFAKDDYVGSYNSLIGGNKMSFEDPASSRIVKRLGEDKHNCWSDCSENAQEVLDSILAIVEGIGEVEEKESNLNYTSEEISLSDIPLAGENTPAGLSIDFETGDFFGSAQLSPEATSHGGYSVVLPAIGLSPEDESWVEQGLEESSPSVLVTFRVSSGMTRRVGIRALISTFERAEIAIQLADHEPQTLSFTPPQDAVSYEWYEFSLSESLEPGLATLRIWSRSSA